MIWWILIVLAMVVNWLGILPHTPLSLLIGVAVACLLQREMRETK